MYYVNPDQRRGSSRYRCRSSVKEVDRPFCGNPSVLACMMDNAINKAIMAALGNTPVVRRVFVPGTDTTAELERANRAIVNLCDDRDAGLFVGEKDEADWKKRMAALIARRIELEALPQQPDCWEQVPVKLHRDDCPAGGGEDVYDCPCAPLEWWYIWPDIVQDTDERREFLRRAPFRFVVGDVAPGGGRVISVMRVPEDCPTDPKDWEEIVSVVQERV